MIVGGAPGMAPAPYGAPPVVMPPAPDTKKTVTPKKTSD
jgi:hypothetical protein